MIKNNHKSAFTFIEVIVVISVIAILITISAISISRTRSQARDLQRLNDIKEIRLALELYYRDTKTYPLNLHPGEPLHNPLNPNITYLEKIPSNPPYSKNEPCNNADYLYVFNYDTWGPPYYLAFCLENNVSEYNSGEYCASPGYIGYGPCF